MVLIKYASHIPTQKTLAELWKAEDPKTAVEEVWSKCLT